MSTAFETKAYHKSSLRNAGVSIHWQAFFVSEGDDLWLGNGIYFWERYTDARWWNGKYISPVILSAILRCDTDLFLDLDNRFQKKAFIDFMEEALEQAKKRGLVIISDSDEIIGAASCNYYKGINGTKLIRYSFPEKSGRPQYCATDTTIASDIKMVSFEQNGTFKEVQNEIF